jgi:hypothetical protein
VEPFYDGQNEDYQSTYEADLMNLLALILGFLVLATIPTIAATLSSKVVRVADGEPSPS